MTSPIMEIQKAKHLYLEMDKKTPDIDREYYIFEKHDGWFGYLDFPSCIIHSRAHREIPALKELSDLIRSQRPDVKGRLIFEIMIVGLEYDSFHELNGILNRKTEIAEGAYLMVHDFIPNFQFCDMPFKKRFQFAREIVSRLQLPEVRMSPLLGVSEYPNVWQYEAERIWQRGGEGIILKAADALYEPKARKASLMKIKEEVSVEMLVLDVVEGTGDHAGMVGKLLCKDEAGAKHEIGMGAATHEERTLWLGTPSAINNHVVEVKAMKKLKDGSYREPRFKAIRFDKDIHELG